MKVKKYMDKYNYSLAKFAADHGLSYHAIVRLARYIPKKEIDEFIELEKITNGEINAIECVFGEKYLQKMKKSIIEESRDSAGQK